MFTCSGTGLAIVWDPASATNTSVMSDTTQPGNVFRTSRLSVLAIEENNNTAITCIIIRLGGNLQRNQTLTIYG